MYNTSILPENIREETANLKAETNALTSYAKRMIPVCIALFFFVTN
jgi:hypothetical protein